MSDAAVHGTRVIERPDGYRCYSVQRARFQVTAGPDAGHAALFERTSLSIGTDADNDLVLTDPTVSAHHLAITVDEHGVLLTDRSSRNGTFVDGARVRAMYLDRAATIRIGCTEIRFVFDETRVEIPVSRATNFGGLLGHSPPMQAVFAVLEQAARTDATVLVMGESGTGKELVARALHERSRRVTGPFVVFDCGAASATLVEGQLFGHAKGAFTGAVSAQAGVFEEADGGTVVLDEIGELALELQPKLLRVLESRTVQRVGEVKPRSVDVRFVACTNRNLEEEVRAGRFRQDLYFRLGVIVVRMPSLRERKQEIPRLLRHFLGRFANDAPVELSPTVLAAADAYDWPGNVRELRNFAERCVTLPNATPSALLGVAGHTGAPPSPNGAVAGARSATAVELRLPFHEAKARWTDEFERAYLSRALASNDKNLSEVARVAGISRQSLYRLLKKHGLGDEEPG